MNYIVDVETYDTVKTEEGPLTVLKNDYEYFSSKMGAEEYARMVLEKSGDELAQITITERSDETPYPVYTFFKHQINQDKK